MSSTSATLTIRDARADEHAALGALLVEVYAALEGFPTPAEQPGYYAQLAAVGRFTEKPGARVLAAFAGVDGGALVGGVVYFGDMAHYGSGGAAPGLRHASGIRLLGVSPKARGLGVGRALTERCIALARAAGHAEVVLHTTQAMQQAWAMYERMGFVRSPDLDFEQQGFPVMGFRLRFAAP